MFIKIHPSEDDKLSVTVAPARFGDGDILLGIHGEEEIAVIQIDSTHLDLLISALRAAHTESIKRNARRKG